MVIVQTNFETLVMISRVSQKLYSIGLGLLEYQYYSQIIWS